MAGNCISRGTIALGALLAGTLGLGACGGGGGGEVASIPPPPPPPASTDLRAPISSPVTPTESFTSVAASVGENGRSFVGAVAGPGQTVIGRDASGGYSITLPLYSQTANGSFQIVDRKVEFSANTLFDQTGGQKAFEARQSPASPARADNTLHIYEGAATDYFVDGGLQHVKFGELTVCNTATAMGCEHNVHGGSAFFAFGDATPAGAIPLSGTASYSGDLYGWLQLTGDVALSVNFASQSISGAFTNMEHLSGDQAGGLETVHDPDLGVSGRIDTGGTLSGILTSGGESAAKAGEWNAQFYGPGASEIGGAFLIGDTPGVFGLRKD